MTEAELFDAVHAYAMAVRDRDGDDSCFRFNSIARTKLQEAIRVYYGTVLPLLHAKAAVCDAYLAWDECSIDASAFALRALLLQARLALRQLQEKAK